MYECSLDVHVGRVKKRYFCSDIDDRIVESCFRTKYNSNEPQRLIRVLTGRSLDSQGYKVSSSGQRRLSTACVDAQAELSLSGEHVRRYVF